MDASLTKVELGESPLVRKLKRAASYHQFPLRCISPDFGLKLEHEREEVRQFGEFLLPAGHVRPRHLTMLHRHVIMFETKVLGEYWAVEARDISSRVDSLVIHLKLFVDDDAVVDSKPRFLSQFDVRSHADAYPPQNRLEPPFPSLSRLLRLDHPLLESELPPRL